MVLFNTRKPSSIRQAHYTLTFDRSDDDNERDPVTFRYASAKDLGPEYGWSDRDRRHLFSGYLLLRLPGEVLLNNVDTLPLRLPGLGAVRPPGRTGRAVDGPDLRRRRDPRTQHAPPRQRVLLPGSPGFVAVRGGRRAFRRAGASSPWTK